MLVGGTGKYELVSKEVSLDPKDWYKFPEVSSPAATRLAHHGILDFK